MKQLGDFLRVILEEAFELNKKDILDILKIKGSTYESYKNNVNRAEMHNAIELYASFLELFGIDLYMSVIAQRITIVNPTRLSPEEIQKLKDRDAYVGNIPVFNGDVPPSDKQKKYPEPAFLVPKEMCPDGEFGVQMPDNIVGSAIDTGNFFICGEPLTVQDIVPEQVYLFSFFHRAGRTLTIGKAKEKAGEMYAIHGDSIPKKIVLDDKVKQVYKIVGQYSNAAGVGK